MNTPQINLEELEQFLSTQSEATKIYIGGDSEKVKHQGVWHADYATVVVIHIDGCRGCRIFGEVVRERVYDQKKDRPTLRLMTEVHKISEMFLRIEHLIQDFETQIHLDLNAKKIHASNHVVAEAIGYIKGVCNINPQIKPDAFSASYAADRFKEVLSFRAKPPTAANMTKPKKRRKAA
jgi:predicted RNase H-related nuclease YkuK (DUF458 family)